ncbi:30S ribosomal protein S7 [soil metagenome]
MSRGTRKIDRKELAPDAVYGSVTVSKMINYIMKNGKKTVATKIAYGAIEKAAAKLEVEPLDMLETAIKNVTPVVEVRGRRVGGANLQVPVEVPRSRRLMLALRWILDAARNAKGKPMNEKLANELVAAYNNEGSAIRKKDETHRMAEANRAFAHFARR